MASATDSARNDEADLVLTWSGRWTLTHRILAVNILTLAICRSVDPLPRCLSQPAAGGARSAGPERGRLVAAGRSTAVAGQRRCRIAQRDRPRRPLAAAGLRPRRASGSTTAGPITGPTYTLARSRHRGVAQGRRAGARPRVQRAGRRQTPARFRRAASRPGRRLAGDRARRGRRPSRSCDVRQAPDLTPVFSAAAPLADGSTLLVTDNDRNFTRTVRSQRGSLGDRARRSRHCCRCCCRCSWRGPSSGRCAGSRSPRTASGSAGRARCEVPRLPSRRDEIGMLARAVSDMSQSLRHRIDNIEAFAADVTHELKNPLASLRSAVDSLERVDDPELRAQLLDVVRQDVVRLDRLIGDVSEAARTDAELARARFEPVDLGPLIEQIGRRLGATARDRHCAPRLRPAAPREHDRASASRVGWRARSTISSTMRSASRRPTGWSRSPPSRSATRSCIRVDDEGPGVPDELREAIFNRFHSVRPESESFRPPFGPRPCDRAGDRRRP